MKEIGNNDQRPVGVSTTGETRLVKQSPNNERRNTIGNRKYQSLVSHMITPFTVKHVYSVQCNILLHLTFSEATEAFRVHMYIRCQFCVQLYKGHYF